MLNFTSIGKKKVKNRYYLFELLVVTMTKISFFFCLPLDPDSGSWIFLTRKSRSRAKKSTGSATLLCAICGRINRIL
jgi:hypothetical protein